jgi:glycogen debranching enzyme
MANVAVAGVPAPIHDLTATVAAPASVLADADGQIRAVGAQGLFLGDTRVLSRARLSVDATEPHGLSRFHDGPGRTRFVGFLSGMGDPIGDPTVRVDRVRQVRPDGLDEEIRLRSTASTPVRGLVTVDLACDLATLEAVKLARPGPGLAARRDVDADGRAVLVWADATMVVTVVAPDADPSVDPERIAWRVDLPPGGDLTLRWSVTCVEPDPVVVAATAPVEWVRPEVEGRWPGLARLLARSLDDLAGLRLAEPVDPTSAFIAAGVPWFLTLFGRDSLWAARMLLPLGTDLAETTLRVLARRQGSVVNPVSGEQPGKIMHELRRVDVRLGPAGPSPAPYYGTVDATLLWISLLAEAWRWGLSETAVVAFLPNLRAALSWLERYADPNGDGFVEYLDRSGRGLANQGWKDSGAAIRFHDGTLARPPIALCEVQGYAHRAAFDAATLLDAVAGSSGEAESWRGYAATLSARFRERFWVRGRLGDHPALALDGRGRPVDSLTSNIGHLLGTGILDDAEEAQVAELLGTDAMCGGYGLRTMSTADRGYAPLSYHCGSVWPHDTAIALAGLSTAAGRGVPTAEPTALRLVTELLDAAEAFDHRLPELYGGDPRTPGGRPVPHPGACRPQGWSAAAAVVILAAALGLAVDVPAGRVAVRPLTGLGPLAVRGLRIGGAPVAVEVDGDGQVDVSGLPDGLRRDLDPATR